MRLSENWYSGPRMTYRTFANTKSKLRLTDNAWAVYVAPDPKINPWVFDGVIRDARAIQESSPETVQASLNAILECVRSSFGNRFIEMIGTLTAAGHHPQEAMWRVLANAIWMGVLLERRLSSDGAAATEAAPAPTPEGLQSQP